MSWTLSQFSSRFNRRKTNKDRLLDCKKNKMWWLVIFQQHMPILLTSGGKKGACKLTQIALPKSASPMMINVSHWRFVKFGNRFRILKLSIAGPICCWISYQIYCFFFSSFCFSSCFDKFSKIRNCFIFSFNIHDDASKSAIVVKCYGHLFQEHINMRN